jgi:hypothetical protein
MFPIDKYPDVVSNDIIIRVGMPFVVLKNCFDQCSAMEINDAYKTICQVFQEVEEKTMTNVEHADMLVDIFEGREDVLLTTKYNDQPYRGKLHNLNPKEHIVNVTGHSFLNIIDHQLLGQGVHVEVGAHGTRIWWNA